MSLRATASVWELVRQNKYFRRFSLGLLVSRIGDVFNGIAMAWLALQIAGPRELGLVVLLGGLIRVPFSPVAGYMLDQFDTRTLLVFDNVGRALVIAVIPTLLWTDLLTVWSLYLVAGLCGILSTVTDVGENLVTPALVSDRQLEPANAMLSLTWEGAALAGPVAAGFLIEATDIATAFVIDASTFAVMAVAVGALPAMRPGGAASSEGGRPQFTAGVRALLAMPQVRVLTLIAAGFLLLSGTVEVLFPAYSKYSLNTDASGFGFLMTSAGLGAVLGVVVLAPLFGRIRPRTALTLVLASHGALFFPLAATSSLELAIVLIFLLYLASGPFYTIDRTLVQRVVPSTLRGRVFGARRAFTAFGFPFGAGIGGPLIVWFGAPASMVLIGSGILIVAATAWFAPALRSIPVPTPDPETTRHRGS